MTRLLRNPPATVLPGTKVSLVDYGHPESLESALKNHIAVVSSVSRSAVDSQFALIDTAIAVGVHRFIPSEFGANLQKSNARKLVNYESKVRVEEYLAAKAKAGEIGYTFIYTNSFADWSIKAGILLNLRQKAIKLYNGGNDPVSMSTLSTAAHAVLAVLSNPKETKNRALYVHAFVASQQDFLAYAKELSPNEPWTEEVVDLGQMAATGGRDTTDMNAQTISIFHVGAMQACFGKDYGSVFGEEHNDLLHLKTMSETYIRMMFQEIYNKL